MTYKPSKETRDSSPKVACPTCNTLVSWSPDNPWRPFCSERCRLIDLGAWFEERNRIPDSPALPDQEPLD